MKRYFILFLTLALLFSITVKPMSVHAVEPVSTTVTLGLVAGGAAAAVPIAIAVVAILIIYYCGLELIKDDLALLIYKAELVYNSLEAEAKEWVESFKFSTAPKVIPFRTRVQLKKSIEQNAGEPDPDKDGNMFVFPDATMLLTLGAISTADIISNNALYNILDSISATLLSIQEEVHDFAFDVGEAFGTLGEHIRSLPSQISTALSNSFEAVSSGLSTLKTTVSTYINNASTRFENAIIYNVKPYLTLISERADALFEFEIAPLLKDFKTNVITGFSSAVSELKLGFASVTEYLQNIPLAGGATNGNDDGTTDMPNMNANGALGLWYFGQAGELLSKYATPLLAGGAIFNLFAKVPFISDLLTFSLSIGIVGALLGIAISAFNKDDRNSAKSKRGGTV